MQVGKMMAILALTIAVAAPQSASAQHGFEPLVLLPTSDWVLDYSSEYCSLVRRFGAGEEEIMLQIANFGAQEQYALIVVGDLVPHSNGPLRELSVRMGSMPDFAEKGASMGVTSGKNSVQWNHVFLSDERYEQESDLRKDKPWLAWPRDEQFERSITSIDLDFGDREITLRTGPAWAVLEAMRECRDNLLTSWGINPTVQNSLSRSPALRRGTIARLESTFPYTVRRQGQSAIIHYRVMVDAAGEAESCTIQVPSPEPAFDEALCRAIQGGFQPALDSNGQAVPSAFAGNAYYYAGG